MAHFYSMYYSHMIIILSCFLANGLDKIMIVDRSLIPCLVILPSVCLFIMPKHLICEKIFQFYIREDQ